ncbi:MAG: type II toxin-antitoxin system RelE/ParE family toxin [Phycisphaerales bacterium]
MKTRPRVLPVIVSPRAKQDIEDHFVYIGAGGQPEAARRFLAAFARTSETLASNPAFGRALRFRAPDLRGLRRCPVIRFHAFQVIYRAQTKELQVVRVLHGSRDIRDALTHS